MAVENLNWFSHNIPYKNYAIPTPVRYKPLSDSGKLQLVFPSQNKDTVKGKGKAIPLLAWTGLEGSRRLRLPDFMTITA